MVNAHKTPFVSHHLQELPFEEEERLDKLFKQLDVNGDGRIDIHDLTEAFESLGMSHHHDHAMVKAYESVLADNQNDSLTAILPIINIMLTISPSTAQCERGFSAMNGLKTQYRTSLNQNSLSHLMRVKVDGPSVKDFNPTDSLKFIEKSDTGKSGDIDFSEFVHYVVEHEKKLSLMFHCLDENKDGKLDETEIISSFFKLGININPKEAASLIKRIDKDGSLDIGFDEWRDYLLFHPSSELHDIILFWRHATYVDIGEDALVPDDFTELELITGMALRHLTAGAVAGAVSRTCTAPLDRIKVFLQVRGNEFKGMKSCFMHMYNEGGVRSLWRGNGINVLKIAPETALKFMTYEQIKQLIRNYTGKDQLSIYERFLAGSSAGGISQTIIYPMEVLKTRLALSRSGQYEGIMNAAKEIYRAGGIKSFYRGYVPNLLGIVPYAGIDLAIYETLKNFHVQRYQQKEPGVLVVLSCAAVSSTCGQLASYPLALVRTQLQAEVVTHSGTQMTMTGAFRNIFRSEGLLGLYRGITPNFLKVAPAVSISYLVYEKVRKLLGASMT
ncbi:Calcium-binding mitochondrial carrier protein SCaMC-2-B [Nymphon striatum]|nr:Calcium-binding mitochondrial carrier protein SCaMC-2-B [Nymphon striatum]